MKNRTWIPYFLKLAGIYNLLWAVFICVSPQKLWRLFHPKASSFPFWVYFLGFIVGILGVLYIWAAKNPLKFRWIIIVGLLSKTAGPIIDFWFFNSEGLVLANLLWFMFVNDILWIFPFLLVLKSIHLSTKVSE